MPKMKSQTGSLQKETRASALENLKKQSQAEAQNQNLNEAMKGCEGKDPKPMNDMAKVREIAAAGDFIRVKERCNSESKATEEGDTGDVDKDDSGLPVTLQYLVYFWEELSTATQKVVSQNLILPSPAVLAKVKKPEKKDKKEGEREKKSKKKKEVKPAGGGGRGNLFGEAAGGLFGGGDRETMCELCGGMYPHPVTYHMRQAHPGCGRHAGGQGYNSGGNFCGGWAGNCGDGGIGGSTWYLMCDRCREKYLREKRQALKEKSKKSKKKSTTIKQSSIMQVMEPHIVMKSNALFLLELASASGLCLPKNAEHQQQQQHRADRMLPSVSESLFDQFPFPPVPFLFLMQRGAQAADSAFAEEVIFHPEEFEHMQCDIHQSDANQPKIPRSDSIGSQDQRPLNQVNDSVIPAYSWI